MKSVSLFKQSIFLVLLLNLSSAGVPPLPILESSTVTFVTPSDQDGPVLVYHVFSINDSTQSLEYYSAFFSLITTNSGHTLIASSNRIDFDSGQLIGLGSQDYRDDGGSDRLDISGLDQSRSIFGGPWRYIDAWANIPPSSFQYKIRSLTEFYLGFRVAADDGNHFGWLRFARSDTTFTNAFDLTAYEWNPIPGASIRAGLTPEIPLATEVVDDGSGQPVLRVSWNAALATWIFETTTDLTPPVTWTEYPAGGTSADVPLDGDDTHRYFRLRRP